MIIAFFLYLFGTGPVKGFAVTLTLGLLANLFTALYVTRAVMEYMHSRGWLTGDGRCQLVGAVPGNIAEFVYSSGRELRFGLGPFIIADNKFYILDDNGALTMMKIEGAEGKILGSHRIIDGNDAWGPLAVADGRMILRDLNQMVCIDLTGKIKDQQEAKKNGKE
jgi:hypothetical protein